MVKTFPLEGMIRKTAGLAGRAGQAGLRGTEKAAKGTLRLFKR